MKIFLATYPLFDSGGTQASFDTDEVPDELKAALRDVGTSAYANGFFRFVAAADFRDYGSLFDLDPPECYPFLKCAFGHLIVYHRQEYKLLDPVFSSVDVLGEEGNLNFVLDIALCDRPSVENTFMLDVYEQAFPRLGAPQVDEIYAFVPALKLGGSREASNVRKSAMAVEMSILTQL